MEIQLTRQVLNRSMRKRIKLLLLTHCQECHKPLKIRDKKRCQHCRARQERQKKQIAYLSPIEIYSRFEFANIKDRDNLILHKVPVTDKLFTLECSTKLWVLAYRVWHSNKELHSAIMAGKSDKIIQTDWLKLERDVNKYFGHIKR